MRTIRFRLVLLAVAMPLLLSASPALAVDGAALYKQKCSGCHGPDGKAESAGAKAMKIPPIAGKTAADVIAKVRASAKHKGLSSNLSDEELSAIAAALPH